jgi:VRR-NUC domain
MLEQTIQTRLIRQFKSEGYYIIKLIRASKSGYPDLLLLKDGVATWVEVKAPGGRISPMQRLRAKELIKAGCVVRFMDDKGDIDATFS